MKTIRLAEAISSNIAIRSRLRTVLDAAGKEVTVDFTNVEFMSRSCADEYLKWRKDKTVVEKNVPDAVRTMIQIVLSKSPQKVHAHSFGAVEAV